MKVSFFTVSMNRLHHLKATLPANLANNSEPFCEFILLDYNSTDGTEQWVKDNCGEFLNNGKLQFYKTLEPESFHRSHSRNILLRIATGDVLCNVDADNFTGQGFGNYIITEFQKSSNIFLTGGPSRDTMGRICALKQSWTSINGFDEKFDGYGYEDTDVINRLGREGLTALTIPKNYLSAIVHDHEQRLINDPISKALKSVFVGYESESRSQILYIMSSGEFIHGSLNDSEAEAVKLPEHCLSVHKQKPMYQILDQPGWTRGEWHETADITATLSDGVLSLNTQADRITYAPGKGTCIFYRMTNTATVQNSLFFYFEVQNSFRMEQNGSRGDRVNIGGLGKATLYKNFNYSTPIVLE